MYFFTSSIYRTMYIDVYSAKITQNVMRKLPKKCTTKSTYGVLMVALQGMT